MGGDKAFRALLVVVLVAVAVGEQEIQGPVHHVVGGHRRWDPTSDISSWLSGRVFRVGDKICKQPSSLKLCFVASKT